MNYFAMQVSTLVESTQQAAESTVTTVESVTGTGASVVPPHDANVTIKAIASIVFFISFLF
jgi:hypothetical protein